MLKAKTFFQSTRLGTVKAGDRVPDDEYGKELIRLGLAEREPEKTYETKVVREEPTTPKRKTKRKSKAKASKRVDDNSD